MERGLAAMVSALEQDGCRPDPFIRAEANLVVVFVTDEDDNDVVPVSEIVAQLVRYKPPEQTRIAVRLRLGTAGGPAEPPAAQALRATDVSLRPLAARWFRDAAAPLVPHRIRLTDGVMPNTAGHALLR